jgi:serine/threonine-protein kinase
MVLKNGSVKVADFGIARVMSKSNTLTKEALGSVHYISPEQAKGGRVDNRSDIYSLGVVMYEMMAGRPPFDGESPVAVAIQHINGGAAMPSTLNPNIPGGLEQIIMKAMAHDPADRYESATNMLYDMDEFRKEPSMLFDYNLPALDVVTRINAESVAPQSPAQPPKTTAERMAASGRVETGRIRQQDRQTGRVAQNRNTAPRRGNETSRQAARRRAAERQAEETRSRIATIAIVICSLVAIMAIGIFLVTLFSDGLFGTQPEKLTVPTLIGKDYTTVQDQYPQFTFDIKKDYSSEYDKNVIMQQTPKAGDEVIRGTQIVITVSLGEKPREQVMDDLTGISQAEAEAFLANKKLNLQPLIKRESHATIPAGSVIRTEPAEGEPLVKGQTVTIFISSGPEVTEAKVPNVVGRNIETAIKIMNNNGFKNIEIENVDSDAPKDQVVRQSEDANQQIDVTTVIVLEVSNGPTEPSTEETVESTTDATEPDLIARKLNVTLPELTEEFTVAIKLDDQTLYEVTLQPGTTQLVYTVYGYGVRYYEIWINDIYHESMRIDFAVSESGQ